MEDYTPTRIGCYERLFFIFDEDIDFEINDGVRALIDEFKNFQKNITCLDEAVVYWTYFMNTQNIKVNKNDIVQAYTLAYNDGVYEFEWN